MTVEQFQVFDAQGRATGLRPRDLVHRRGYWHKSAQVFVFDTEQRLLVQRRAPDKDLYPDLWDYSVGEHLRPDEQAIDGAHRGLAEELGLVGQALTVLGGVRHVVQQGSGYFDREIQQAFACVTTDAVLPDGVEVCAVRWVSLPDLAQWVNASPGSFTPWFLRDMRAFNFFREPLLP